MSAVNTSLWRYSWLGRGVFFNAKRIEVLLRDGILGKSII